MATKQEIIDRLSQCGGLSYQDWIRLLDSIYFDGDITDFFIDVNSNVLPTPEINFGITPFLNSGTYTYNSQSFTIPEDHYGYFKWDGSSWSLKDMGELPKNPSEVEDWAEGSYKNGVLVYHNGRVWRSLIDNNEDEPSVGIGSWEDMTFFQNMDSDLVNITDQAEVLDGVYINIAGDFVSAADFSVYKIETANNGYIKFTGASYLVATATNNLFPVMWAFSDSDEIIAPLVYSNTGSSIFNMAMVRDYRSNTSDGFVYINVRRQHTVSGVPHEYPFSIWMGTFEHQKFYDGSNIDKRASVYSEAPLANKVIAPSIMLLERFVNEATQTVYKHGNISGFADALGKYTDEYMGRGTMSITGVFEPSPTSGTLVSFKGIPIPENTTHIGFDVGVFTGAANVNIGKPTVQLQKGAIVKNLSLIQVNGNPKSSGIVEVEDFDELNLTMYATSLNTSFEIFFYNTTPNDEPVSYIDKDYLYNSLGGSNRSFANPLGRVVDVSSFNTSLTTGYATLYYPCLVSTDKMVSPLARYYLYFSTDHAGNAGKIGLCYSDDLTNWFFYGDVVTSAIMGWSTRECETPCVLWNQNARKYYMYFQTNQPLDPATGYAQATLVAESENGLDWTYVKQAFSIDNRKMKGNGHNGYAIVQNIGGYYVANSLFGGGAHDSRATHYSRNGLDWITIQKERAGWANSQFFYRNGQYCCVVLMDSEEESGSGGVLGQYRSFGLAYLNDNFDVVGKEWLSYIVPDGSPQPMASVLTYEMDGEIYILYVINKTSIHIKKLI